MLELATGRLLALILHIIPPTLTRKISTKGLFMLKALLYYICLFSILTTLFRVTPDVSIEDMIFSHSCQEQHVSSHTSPSSLFTATIVGRDCGATTSYSRNIMIESKDKKEQTHPSRLGRRAACNKTLRRVKCKMGNRRYSRHFVLQGQEFLSSDQRASL